MPRPDSRLARNEGDSLGGETERIDRLRGVERESKPAAAESLVGDGSWHPDYRRVGEKLLFHAMMEAKESSLSAQDVGSSRPRPWQEIQLPPLGPILE